MEWRNVVSWSSNRNSIGNNNKNSGDAANKEAEKEDSDVEKKRLTSQ